MANDSLDQIKARMSDTQKKDMAEIIRKEMERRGISDTEDGGNEETRKRPQSSAARKGSLSPDDMRELYTDVGKAMQQMKLKNLEGKVQVARRASTGNSKVARSRVAIGDVVMSRLKTLQGVSGSRGLLMAGVAVFGIAKVAFSLGLFGATAVMTEPQIASATKLSLGDSSVINQVSEGGDVVRGTATGVRGMSDAERELLMQLDARRVELDRRRENLDKHEQELKEQEKLVGEKISELRGLTAKLAEFRKDKERKSSARVDQLTNVYSAMEPKEAADLIGKLDNEIALHLLERLPEKRMGQIFGFMDKGRAVELTKLLSR